MVRYEDVSSTKELNQKVTDYMAIGYKVGRKTSKFATLIVEKKKFMQTQNNNIIWEPTTQRSPIRGIDRGGSTSTITDFDLVIIRVKNEDNADSSSVVGYCTKCGTDFFEGAKFCRECGNSYQEIQQTVNNSIDNINCPFCGEELPIDTFRWCCYCGMSLHQETERGSNHSITRDFKKNITKKSMKLRGFFEKE